jgi:hypothetical protein
MNNPLVKVAIAGIFTYAIYRGSLSVFAACAGIVIAFCFSHAAGIGTKLMMVIVGAMSGGLAGEICRTFWLHVVSPDPVGSALFLDALLVSLVCTASAWLAIVGDWLLARLVHREG